MGEHLPCTQGVVGSNPIRSIPRRCICSPQPRTTISSGRHDLRDIVSGSNFLHFTVISSGKNDEESQAGAGRIHSFGEPNCKVDS